MKTEDKTKLAVLAKQVREDPKAMIAPDNMALVSDLYRRYSPKEIITAVEENKAEEGS